MKGIKRTLWFQPDLNDPNNPGNTDDEYTVDELALLGRMEPRLLRSGAGSANLVSSLTYNGRHAPVIDLDVPARLVPSKTPGHSHLYIDHEMEWSVYLELLQALAKNSIVESNYVRFTEARGMSFVRLHPDSRPARQREEEEYPFDDPRD